MSRDEEKDSARGSGQRGKTHHGISGAFRCGENISSVEIEDVLYHRPAVTAVAVVATPDKKWGEVPRAFVELKPGATTAAEELRDFCRERMAHFREASSGPPE